MRIDISSNNIVELTVIFEFGHISTGLFSVLHNAL